MLLPVTVEADRQAWSMVISTSQPRAKMAIFRPVPVLLHNMLCIVAKSAQISCGFSVGLSARHEYDFSFTV